MTRAHLRPLLLEVFVTVNLAFLVADIYVAHSVNAFRERAEWIPFWFAAGAALLVAGNLAAAWWGLRKGEDGGRAIHRGPGRTLGIVLGGTAVLVGVSGLILHLESGFFREATLQNLVYSAPFVAPLAFAGLGFLLLLNRMVEHGSSAWGAWVLLLALGGWLGNFGLSLADHAQNGFFFVQEWIPVVSAALAAGWLATVFIEDVGRRFLHWALGLMALQAGVGLLGFWLHVAPVLREGAGTLWSRIVFGPPVFAPLLFANLALLAALGVWELLDHEPGAPPGPSSLAGG